MDMTTAATIFTPVVREGQGPTRKTRKSAEREARLWNESSNGTPYLHTRRTYAFPHRPAGWESCVAEARPVEGGFACVYVTTFVPVETLDEEAA